MNFNAVQNSINDILSVKRKYIIPRNQREFSWEKMQLDEFWDDVTRNIKLNEKGEFTYSEYFLGTIVLAGSDSSPSLDVIDGQQRLTVITMAITTISRILRDLGFEEYADDVFNAYVVTNVSQVALSKSPQRSAKLEKTNGNDFFKLKFQDKVDHEPKVVFEEDAKLLYAGKYLNRKLSKASACELLKKKRRGVKYSEEDYANCLIAIQTMLTRYINVVRISVSSEEDAYDIFEILNARGINLTSIDLIKNKILQYCTETYPLDFAKKQWSGIDEKLKSRQGKLTLSDYVRAYWLSNYAYVGQDGLYRAFKKLLHDDHISPQEFLTDLNASVDIYVKICSPHLEDWKTQDQKAIFESLRALQIMDVSVPRPLLMSALALRGKRPKAFKQSQLIELFNNIVSFHFKYNAVCKLKPSGWDQSYSSWAIEFSQCVNKTDVSTLLAKIYQKLVDRTPSETEYVTKFCSNLSYSNAKPSQRNLIRYIFGKVEMAQRQTQELTGHLITLEHIGSQANYNGSNVGMVGNLIPLDPKLNELAGDKAAIDKLDVYKQSDLLSVQEFLVQVELGVWDLEHWNDEIIKQRTVSIAKVTYSLI